jgi:hypothetical protein
VSGAGLAGGHTASGPPPRGVESSETVQTPASEIIGLERKLADAVTNRDEYRILRQVDLLLYAMIQAIPEPTNSSRMKALDEDKTRANELFERILNAQPPIKRTPLVRPRTGSSVIEYDFVTQEGQKPMGTFAEAQFKDGANWLTSNERENAFYESTPVLWRAYATFHAILARWKLWYLGSEFNLTKTGYTRNDFRQAVEHQRTLAAAAKPEKRSGSSDNDE